MKCGETIPDRYVGAASFEAFLLNMISPMVWSIFINACLFVGEIAMRTFDSSRDVQRAIDGFAHIILGPVTAVTFYSSDSFGTLLFFGSLWHFFCDSGQTRPSYVLLLPGMAGRTSRIDYFRWCESFMFLLHHIFMGAVKLALCMGDINKSNERLLLFVFIMGAGLSHISFGMNIFGIRGAFNVLKLAQVLRLGAAATTIGVTAGKNDDWYFLMIGDLIWLGTVLAIRLAGVLMCPHDEIEGADVTFERGCGTASVRLLRSLSLNSINADRALVLAFSNTHSLDAPVREQSSPNLVQPPLPDLLSNAKPKSLRKAPEEILLQAADSKNSDERNNKRTQTFSDIPNDIELIAEVYRTGAPKEVASTRQEEFV